MYKAKYANSGSRSAFFIIDDGRGFKEFESHEDAAYARAVQEKLAVFNLAPNVLSEVGKIRIFGKELSRWGFMTEIAEMIGCGGNECGCGECNDLCDRYQPKINRLVREVFNKTDCDFMDNHIGNVGLITRKGKKKLVCIDTGSESVYDADLEAEYIGSYDSYSDGCCSCTVCRGSYNG